MSNTRKQYDKLIKKWKHEIRFVSSATEICYNKHLLKAIALGDVVIPWMLQDIYTHHLHLFVALSWLTGDQPVPEEHAGNIPKMINDWMEWADSHGIEIDKEAKSSGAFF